MRWIADPTISPLSESLADITTESGENLLRQYELDSVPITLAMTRNLTEVPPYRLLQQILPAEKVALYFEKRVWDEIHPIIRLLPAGEWYLKNRAPNTNLEIVWQNHGGLGPCLQSVWPSKTVSLKLESSRLSYRAVRLALGRLYRKVRRLGRHVNLAAHRSTPRVFPNLTDPVVAVQCLEGFDATRRSDLFWHGPSGIHPSRLLIQFDNVRAAYRGSPVPNSALREIEECGMSWISHEEGAVARQEVAWSPDSSGPESLLEQFKGRKGEPADQTEAWVIHAAEELLWSVDYWRTFYQVFNVRVQVDVAGIGSDRHIAQWIALDFTGGVLAGWQRSELTHGGPHVGHYTNHVFFVWNANVALNLTITRNRVGHALVSGFSHGGAWKLNPGAQESRAMLASKGSEFVIALFDNAFQPFGRYSRNMVLTWYSAFLDWVIEDPQVGVITKSKKQNPFADLPELRELMERAEATGRWVNLDHVDGRLPSDASRVADMSVAMGISSTIFEAAAAGGRGIHCDVTKLLSHPFYDWGYEKVVFTGVEPMMVALKRFKADPASEPDLGNFSQRMEQVDPYHDGGAGERIGCYIRWLLDAFEAGQDREAALQQANERYGQRWGADKVICLEVPISLPSPQPGLVVRVAES